MRLILAAVLALSIPCAANARIQTLPVSDLVATAELIVVADVASIVEMPARTDSPRIRNELKVVRVLKGTYDPSKPLVLMTWYKPGERAREDSLVFPEPGSRVLLFLRTGPRRSLVTVNGIQGLWPIEQGTGQTQGMGFRYSIAEVERLIAQ